ncbi:MAG: GldM family protein [Saprospiraceae bacterium]
MRKHPQIPALLIALFILFSHILRAQDDVPEFHLISNVQSGYVVTGEQAKADLLIIPKPDENYFVFLTVNDAMVDFVDGQATYRKNAHTQGPQRCIVKARVKHLESGSEIILADTFSYEVGLRCIATSADKMNVFYIGVDNPLSVSAAGIPSDKINVSISSGTLTSNGNDHYTVQVEKPGQVEVTVDAPGLKSIFYFRAKRLPDPIAQVGARYSGDFMTAGEFKAQGGVIPILENFDFDARCEMQGYEVVRLAKDGTRSTAQNTGARFGEEARALVNMAVPGDIYWFRSIKVSCPGDPVARKIQNFSVEMK